MPWKESPDIWGLLGALVISTISGFISISRRILSGHPASLLWVISEFLTAILCGYLMYNAYPTVAPLLPDWITLPVAIAVVSHIGGRIFQELERAVLRRYATFFGNQPY